VRYLNGIELAGYIQNRHLHQVRSLRQSKGVEPRLAIIVCNNDPVIKTYVSCKQQYGQNIEALVDVYNVDQTEVSNLVQKLNKNKKVQGIIIQLPLSNKEQTDSILSLINPKKDIDGLTKKSIWDPATPTAILWLLAGHNVELKNKKIVIVGQGRLVGAPLRLMLRASGVEALAVDAKTKNPNRIISQAQVLITATGKPGIIKASMIPKNCVVIDAGTASENGVIKGDLADDVYLRQDLSITPKTGGVGPLTISALFENLIRAARQQAS